MNENASQPPVLSNEHRSRHPLQKQLWWIAISPSLWAIHFLACYITAAVWCEKMENGSMRPLQISVSIYTAIALPAILCVGWASYRNYRRGDPPIPYDFDDPNDRTHFLGFTAFLLSALSFIATLFTVMVFMLVRSCD